MDIGANMGEWSLHMAKMVGGNGRVFSFEPIPSMVQALEKTIAINNFSQVSIAECAISNKIGHSSFSIPFNKDNQAIPFWSQLVPEEQFTAPKSMDNLWDKVARTKTSEVQTTTLDRFISEKNITKLDFIKIDVEGHEKYVIEGGQKTLETLKPAMILEAASEETAAREIIANQLRKLNYKLVGIVIQDGIIEASWSQYINMKDPFDPSYPVNVLFLPQIIS
jgi:FkbM family methyltransferase